MVGHICYRGKEPWVNVTGGQIESMRRLAHMILSMPIMDCIVVGTSVEIECMPLT